MIFVSSASSPSRSEWAERFVFVFLLQGSAGSTTAGWRSGQLQITNLAPSVLEDTSTESVKLTVQPRPFEQLEADGSPFSCRVAHAGFLDLPHSDDSPPALGNFYRHLERLLDADWKRLLHLAGMHSLAYLSPELRTLYLFRAAASRWPIYYKLSQSGLVWSTRPGDVLPDSAASDIDYDAIPSMILDGRMPNDRTVFSSVRRLPPGHLLTFTAGTLRIEQVSELRSSEQKLTLDEAAHRFRELLGQAVQRCTSVAPNVVTLLSGGVDSAAVAVESAKSNHAAALTLTAEALPAMAVNYRFASRVARSAGLLELRVDTSELLTSPMGYLTPLASVPMLSLCSVNRAEFVAAAREIREKLGPAVVLTGLMAEGLFIHDRDAIYRVSGLRAINPLEQAVPLLRRPDLISNVVRRRRHGNGLPGRPKHWSLEHFARWLNAEALAAAVEFDEIESARYARDLPPLQQLAFSSVSCFIADDSIAHDNAFVYPKQQALQLDPCADQDLVEFSLGLPLKQRIHFIDGYTIDKFLLRYAYMSTLSAEVAAATQQISEALIQERLLSTHQGYFSRVLNADSLLARRGIIDGEGVSKLLREPESPLARPHLIYLLRACAAELWLARLHGEVDRIPSAEAESSPYPAAAR